MEINLNRLETFLKNNHNFGNGQYENLINKYQTFNKKTADSSDKMYLVELDPAEWFDTYLDLTGFCKENEYHAFLYNKCNLKIACEAVLSKMKDELKLKDYIDHFGLEENSQIVYSYEALFWDTKRWPSVKFSGYRMFIVLFEQEAYNYLALTHESFTTKLFTPSFRRILFI